MRVSRLEIFGFKSFVDRLVLNFDHNKVGVVGPNGCGKSNIVDAIRWVLGETHARNLRGNSQEDLIFSGSDSRKSLGLAEVTVVIKPTSNFNLESFALQATAKKEEENIEGAESTEQKILDTNLDSNIVPNLVKEIPSLFTAAEIQFTRRLYRSGESEFFINKVPCRLRDMIDVYRMIGIGARGLSIVQQGEIGEFISRKPTERRALIEEAAGISGIRTKIEAAIKQLDNSNVTLDKLRSVISENERSVKQLEKQAKRAREREGVLNELKNHTSLFSIIKRELIVNKRTDFEGENETLDQDCLVQESEIQFREAQITQLSSTLVKTESQIGDLRIELDRLNLFFEAEKTKGSDLREEVKKLDRVLIEKREELNRKNNDKNRINQELLNLNIEIRKRNETLSYNSGKLDKVQKDLDLLLGQQGIDSFFDIDLMGDYKVDPNIEEKINSISNSIDNLKFFFDEDNLQKMKTLEHEYKENLGLQSLLDEKIRKNELEVAKFNSEKVTLEKQLENYTAQITGKEVTEKIHESIHGILGENIICEPTYRKALTSVIGDKINHILTDNIESSLDILKDNSFLNKKIGFLKIGVCENSAELVPSNYNDLVPLIDKFEIKGEHQNLIKTLLANTFLLEDKTKLKEIYKLIENDNIIVVTLDGIILNKFGWTTTDGKAPILDIGHQLDQVRGKIPALEQSLNSLKQDRISLKTVIEEFLNSLNQHREREKNKFSLERELQIYVIKEQDLKKTFLVSKEREEKERIENKVKQERILQNQLRQLTTEVETAKEFLKGVDSRILSLNLQIEGYNVETAVIQNSQAEHNNELEFLNQRIKSSDIEKAGALKVLEEKKGNLLVRISEIDSEKRITKQQSDKLTAEITKLKVDLEKKRSRIIELQIRVENSIEELNNERESFKQHYLDEYHDLENVAVEKLELIRKDASLQQVAEIERLEIEKLNRKIQREGDVDSSSIAAYEQESTRLNELKTQEIEATSACEILTKTINHLKGISRERFLKTYEDVSRKFEELIPRLFGGGAGKMLLINSEDPLLSGVELHIRPPGKKISNMDLLSGGEKALVAVGVLLAVFLNKPSPICVLDEVDAPLDEANLARYLELINEISKETQFLVITHNKQTMSSLEHLVGITMQERGVSKALTVNFKEAEAYISS